MILEFVTFRRSEDRTEEEFEMACQGIEEYLAACPGFLGRQLYRTAPEDLWIDLVFWSDLLNAEAAADGLRDDPRAGPFLECIEPDSVTLRHASLVRATASASGLPLSRRGTKCSPDRYPGRPGSDLREIR